MHIDAHSNLGSHSDPPAIMAMKCHMCWGPCPGKDGCVVTWGDAAAGGDSSTVQDQLHEVRQVHWRNLEDFGVASAVIWFLL